MASNTSRPSPDTPGQRPLYFAYGSNLSFSQMEDRCKDNPKQSAVPVAIARLDGWKWIICERGYATIIPPPSLRVGRLLSEWGAASDEGNALGNTVYGLLYNMTSGDEAILDGYEVVDRNAPPAKGPLSFEMRPREQGKGHYTKWYVPVTVEKWLPGSASLSAQGLDICTALVYIDEECVCESEPKTEYIARMNRAITEACSIGLSEQWVESAMRRFISLP